MLILFKLYLQEQLKGDDEMATSGSLTQDPLLQHLEPVNGRSENIVRLCVI